MTFVKKVLTHTASQIDAAINAILATQVQSDDITILISDFNDDSTYTIISGGCNSTSRDMRS